MTESFVWIKTNSTYCAKKCMDVSTFCYLVNSCQKCTETTVGLLLLVWPIDVLFL